jgi:hypothetical protein
MGQGADAFTALALVAAGAAAGKEGVDLGDEVHAAILLG